MHGGVEDLAPDFVPRLSDGRAQVGGVVLVQVLVELVDGGFRQLDARFDEVLLLGCEDLEELRRAEEEAEGLVAEVLEGLLVRRRGEGAKKARVSFESIALRSEGGA